MALVATVVPPCTSVVNALLVGIDEAAQLLPGPETFGTEVAPIVPGASYAAVVVAIAAREVRSLTVVTTCDAPLRILAKPPVTTGAPASAHTHRRAHLGIRDTADEGTSAMALVVDQITRTFFLGQRGDQSSDGVDDPTCHFRGEEEKEEKRKERRGEDHDVLGEQSEETTTMFLVSKVLVCLSST